MNKIELNKEQRTIFVDDLHVIWHELYEKEPFRHIKHKLDGQFNISHLMIISFPNNMKLSSEFLSRRLGIFSFINYGLDIDIEQHWKGHFGEIFTILALSDFPLKRPWNVKNADKQVLKIPFSVWFNRGGSSSPDYLVENTNCLIEVKTGKKSRIKKSQSEMFKVFLDNGYKIFLIRPRLICEQLEKLSSIEHNCQEKVKRLSKFERITLKIERFDCYSLDNNGKIRKNDNFKYKKIKFDELKNILITSTDKKEIKK